MGLTKVAGAVLIIWLVLVLVGKGGFVHLLLLNALGLIIVDLTGLYRRNLPVRKIEL